MTQSSQGNESEEEKVVAIEEGEVEEQMDLDDQGTVTKSHPENLPQKTASSRVEEGKGGRTPKKTILKNISPQGKAM